MTVRNRVWDTVASGFVSWETEFPDGYGAQYPGPGTFGTNTSDFCVAGGSAAVEGPAALPDDTFNTDALWLLGGAKRDELGTYDMILDNGSEQYAEGPVDYTQAFSADGSAGILARSGHDAALILLGSVTVSAYIYFTVGITGNRRICWFADSGEAEAENIIWNLSAFGDGANDPQIRYLHEYGAGNNELFLFPTFLALQTWHHLVLVRDDDAMEATLYINGVQDGPAFSYSNSPTGGTTARASIAGNWATNGEVIPGRIAGCKLIPRALTQAEAMAEYKRGLRPRWR